MKLPLIHNDSKKGSGTFQLISELVRSEDFLNLETELIVWPDMVKLKMSLDLDLNRTKSLIDHNLKS